jgi:hypothetical protein
MALGSLVAVATRLSFEAYTVTLVGAADGGGVGVEDGVGEAGEDEPVDEPPPPHAKPVEATTSARTKSARRLPVMMHVPLRYFRAIRISNFIR